MANNSLITAFNIKRKNDKEISSLSDYEIFKDKELLDTLRKDIISSVTSIDDYENKDLSMIINNEIDNVVIPYNLNSLERGHLYNLILNELNGYGPISELLDDDNIDEIMVNGPSLVYISIEGRVSHDKSISFINDEHILRTIHRLLSSTGKAIDSNNPVVEARLEDGSRINAIIPPLSKSPILTIRKFNKKMNDIDDLIRTGSCTPYMARFLEAAVLGKLNILVCGSHASGKTTLLNILGNFIDDKERVAVIEDIAEINLKLSNVISLEGDANTDLSSKEIINSALRMNPDRIIVGNIKDGEAYPLLQAMNTGYNGSIGLMYANGVVDALVRLESMLCMNNSFNISTARNYIYDAIDLIVNIERLSDGKKKITSISELNRNNDGKITVKEIFAFRNKSILSSGEVNGEYILYDGDYRTVNKIRRNGISSVDDIFQENDSILPKIKE